MGSLFYKVILAKFSDYCHMNTGSVGGNLNRVSIFQLNAENGKIGKGKLFL